MNDIFLRRANKIKNKTSDIIINILFTLSIIIVAVVIIQKLYFKDEIPQVCGFKILQVISGSMSGEMEAGEAILIREVNNENELNVGDIITYKEAKNTYVTHRIVEINEENGKKEYILKGDANNTNDVNPVNFDQVEGKYVFKITFMGKLVEYINTPVGMATLCAVPLVLLILFTLKDRKKELKKNMRMEKRLKYELEVKMKNE